MKKYEVILKQDFGRDIKFAEGSKQKILNEVGKTLDEMPRCKIGARESTTFEFVRTE